MFAKQALRLALYMWHAYKIKNYVLSTDLEHEAQHVVKFTLLLGDNVGIHILVYLITKALTFYYPKLWILSQKP